MTDYARAMAIAWEHIAWWRTVVTLQEAAAAVGLPRHQRQRWEQVAAKLARMWLSIQGRDYLRDAA